MKRTLFLLATLGGAILLGSCSPDENAPSNTPSTNNTGSTRGTPGPSASPTLMDRAASGLAAGKTEFLEQARQQLAGLDRQIVSLRQKADALPEEARRTTQETLAPLQGKLSAAQDALARLNASSVEAWQDLKAPFENALSELQTAVESAETHLAK
jgi:hypothetical protein